MAFAVSHPGVTSAIIGERNLSVWDLSTEIAGTASA